VDHSDWDWVEVVVLLSTDPTSRKQAGLLKDAEVLHDAETGHRQIALKLHERLAISLEEAIQQQPPVWVRERLEDFVHGRDDR
jgi:uncharacterized protein YccT (UPF0319 family)